MTALLPVRLTHLVDWVTQASLPWLKLFYWVAFDSIDSPVARFPRFRLEWVALVKTLNRPRKFRFWWDFGMLDEGIQDYYSKDFYGKKSKLNSTVNSIFRTSGVLCVQSKSPIQFYLHLSVSKIKYKFYKISKRRRVR